MRIPVQAGQAIRAPDMKMRKYRRYGIGPEDQQLGDDTWHDAASAENLALSYTEELRDQDEDADWYISVMDDDGEAVFWMMEEL